MRAWPGRRAGAEVLGGVQDPPGRGAAACADCAAAARELWLLLDAACPGCLARDVGRGPLFFAAQGAGELTPAYLAQLRAAKLRHAQVVAARAADWMCRLPQAG